MNIARTREEYEVASMLVGMMYDEMYHLFANHFVTKCYDPDTMELVYEDNMKLDSFQRTDVFGKFLEQRRAKIRNGELPQEVTNA